MLLRYSHSLVPVTLGKSLHPPRPPLASDWGLGLQLLASLPCTLHLVPPPPPLRALHGVMPRGRAVLWRPLVALVAPLQGLRHPVHSLTPQHVVLVRGDRLHAVVHDLLGGHLAAVDDAGGGGGGADADPRPPHPAEGAAEGLHRGAAAWGHGWTR